MANVLHIKASPREERSKSNQVASAFLQQYVRVHPQDKIYTVDVFQEKLPAFDRLAVQAKYAILHGQPHTDEEQTAWSTVEKVIHQFKQADKYLFSLPMWNFGIPYRLKQYIDIVVQPGYTFSVGPNGYEGLIRNKPAVIIYARGGAYPSGTDAQAFDLQKKYMDLILGFMGFENIYSIVIEPTLQGSSDTVQAVVEAAVGQARRLAEVF